ncbi:unnamed protein product, partial [Meganyctiphanes norvegica]
CSSTNEWENSVSSSSSPSYVVSWPSSVWVDLESSNSSAHVSTSLSSSPVASLSQSSFSVSLSTTMASTTSTSTTVAPTTTTSTTVAPTTTTSTTVVPTTTTSPSEEVTTCPISSVITAGDKQFVFFNCPKTYLEARHFCKVYDWTLATPDEQFEQFKERMPNDGEYWLDVQPDIIPLTNRPMTWYWQTSPKKTQSTRNQWEKRHYNMATASDGTNCASIFWNGGLIECKCEEKWYFACESDHFPDVQVRSGSVRGIKPLYQLLQQHREVKKNDGHVQRGTHFPEVQQHSELKKNEGNVQRRVASKRNL